MTSMRRIFISYTRADEAYRSELITHLSPLLLRERIETWTDQTIRAGQNIHRAIEDNILQADIVLLLISADYLSSPSCQSEMEIAFKRRSDGELVIVPIIVRSCDWLILPLGDTLAVPKDGKPIASWSNRDEAWTDVVVEMRKLVEDWQTGTDSADNDSPPTDEVHIADEPEDNSSTSEKSSLKPVAWVRRKDVFDDEWVEVRNSLLRNLNAISQAAKEPKIAVPDRWWGNKLLIDLSVPNTTGIRRVWLQDVGGDPGCPGYQVYLYGDRRIDLSPEQLRWVFMSDQQKYLLPVKSALDEAFTAETYALHVWDRLIKKVA